MPSHLSVGEAADELGCSPKVLSDMLYRRTLDTRRCPVVHGRRQIPRDYLPRIVAELRRAGRAVGE
jgi:hypothetical protein